MGSKPARHLQGVWLPGESWDDKVPHGKRTDFHRAVAAEEGEKIVFTWQIWPGKTTDTVPTPHWR